MIRSLLLLPLVGLFLAAIVWQRLTLEPLEITELKPEPPPAEQKPETATGVMHVRFPTPLSLDKEHRSFTVELLEQCLKITELEFGPYQLTLVPSMTREREYSELKRGELVTVVDNTASKQWEESFNPVYFPLRRGLHNYHLLLVDAGRQKNVLGASSLAQLREFRAGVYQHTLIKDVLQVNQLPYVIGNDYEGLFQMLALERFDYLPRPLDSILTEKEMLDKRIPGLTQHPGLALHVTMPTFYYVNKANTRQQQRIYAGLKKMQKQGEFFKLYDQYYDENFYREILRQRTILRLNNPYINDHPIYRDTALWFNPQNRHAQ